MTDGIDSSRALVHIGYHKTGTTWLQNRVFSNQELGFLSPWGIQAGMSVDLFVHPNPFRFDPEATRATLATTITEANDRNLVPVMSCESLCGSPFIKPSPPYYREVAQRIRETLPTARILITIREQKASIVSHYRQEITVGGYESIAEYIGARKLPPGWHPVFRLDHLEYDLLVAHYQKLFGNEQVLVLPLELLQRDPQTYLDRLYSFSGVNPSATPDMTPERTGHRGASLAFRKTLNAWNIGKLDWTRRRPPLSWRLARTIVEQLDSRLPKGLHDRFDRKTRAGLPDSLDTHYAPSNARLEALTGLGLKELGYPVAGDAANP